MPARDSGMTSLFGRTAINQSLGISGFFQDFSLDSIGTMSVWQRRRDEDSTASSALLETPQVKKSIEEGLYDAKAAAKIFTSKVSTHIKDDWRKQLYLQLDSVLDADEWMEGDEPLAIGSYRTFLRLMLVIRPFVRPGLGLTSEGHLIATWQNGDARLTVYCFDDDEVRYVLSHVVEDRRRTAAGDASIFDLLEMIAPFQPERWFGREPE